MSEFTKYDIEGMHCAACVVSVEKEISKLENSEAVSANLATETLQLKGDVADEQVFEAVKRAGYTAKVREELTLLEDRDKLTGATMRNIKQNLFFAFIYNVIGIPIAMGVFYSMKVHFWALWLLGLPCLWVRFLLCLMLLD